MDPYTKILIGKEAYISPVHSGGGKYPIWNYKVEAKLADEPSVTFQVWDKDTFKDDLVGECILPASKLIGGDFNDILTLNYQGKLAGYLYVAIHFTPK